MRAESLRPEQYVSECLWASPLVRAIFERWVRLGIPEGWLGAGCVAQTVWNLMTGQAPEAHIKDIDLVYFDAADLSGDAESRHAQRLSALFADLSVPLDLKNQARVHRWYPQRFGRAIPPFLSVRAAVATWPTVATSIIVRPDGVTNRGLRPRPSTLEIYAPFGLEDLLAGKVRPNKQLVDAQVYRDKVRRWRECWPQLDFDPW